MYTPNTSVRALVPYQAPPNGVARRTKALLRRLFMGTDRLFRDRRAVYGSMFVIACFGLLLGSFSSLVNVSSFDELRILLRSHCLVILFGNLTLFGCFLNPAVFLFSSLLIGSYLSVENVSFVQEKPLWLFFFLFFYLLFSSEGFVTWFRGRSGWRRMILHRDFILYFFLFLFAIFFL